MASGRLEPGDPASGLIGRFWPSALRTDIAIERVELPSRDKVARNAAVVSLLALAILPQAPSPKPQSPSRDRVAERLGDVGRIAIL